MDAPDAKSLRSSGRTAERWRNNLAGSLANLEKGEKLSVMSLRLPADVLDGIHELARRQALSASEYIRRLLAEECNKLRPTE